MTTVRTTANGAGHSREPDELVVIAMRGAGANDAGPAAGPDDGPGASHRGEIGGISQPVGHRGDPPTLKSLPQPKART